MDYSDICLMFTPNFDAVQKLTENTHTDNMATSLPYISSLWKGRAAKHTWSTCFDVVAGAMSLHLALWTCFLLLALFLINNTNTIMGHYFSMAALSQSPVMLPVVNLGKVNTQESDFILSLVTDVSKWTAHLLVKPTRDPGYTVPSNHLNNTYKPW
jgi:hypothetical protein